MKYSNLEHLKNNHLFNLMQHTITWFVRRQGNKRIGIRCAGAIIRVLGIPKFKFMFQRAVCWILVLKIIDDLGCSLKFICLNFFHKV